jgi:predicted acylesterase/phospholipase RssA
MLIKLPMHKLRKACSQFDCLGRFTCARRLQWRETLVRYSLNAAPFLVFVGISCFAGCTTAARRDAPPNLISTAEPIGFTADVRLLSADLTGFDDRSSKFLQGVRDAAAGGDINVLSLSGGGSGGAFGAGALFGLSQAHSRPTFHLVTGVSAGALIAPFAFLGPKWDEQLKEAFTGAHPRLLHSASTALISRLFSPLGSRGHGALFRLVDGYVTTALIDAVAREAASGRRLLVATTDLDKQETVIWNLGVIAAHGGELARKLFRDVLIASASVPGIFPPMLIHVRSDAVDYDELHVDGGVTTTLFAAPLMAAFHPYRLELLRGAKLYMIVNGQLAQKPAKTPVNTPQILARSLSAGMTYRTREAIGDAIELSQQLGMTLRLTEIPIGYPKGSYVDFNSIYRRTLFNYGNDCATAGMLWVTPEQSVRRNGRPVLEATAGKFDCPSENLPAALDP